MDQFVIDSAHFQSLRDRNMLLSANDLDTSFNNIENYFNKKLKPVIELFSNNPVPGVSGSPNTYLRNVGDGTTSWSEVTANDFPALTFSLSKLSPSAPGSILASGRDGSIKAVASLRSEQKNQMLICNRQNLLPEFQTPIGRFFASSSIPSSKVDFGTLSERHLASDVIELRRRDALISSLATNAIEAAHLIQNSIPRDKIAAGAFIESKCSPSLLAMRIPESLQYQDKAISSRHISTNTIEYSAIAQGRTLLPFSIIPSHSITIVPNQDIDPWITVRNKLAVFNLMNESFVADKQYGQIDKSKLSPELKEILKRGGLKV